MTGAPRHERLLEAARATKGLHARRRGSRAGRPRRAAPRGRASLPLSKSAPTAGGPPSIWLRGSPGPRRRAPATAVIFSVDHHRGSEENQAGFEHHDETLVDNATGRIDTLPFWRKAVEGAGAEDLAIAVVGDSPTIAARWEVAAGLVFIDGGHGEAPAWADYRGWAPRVANGGWLAIHDVFPDPAAGGRPPFEIYRRRAQLRRVRGGAQGANREPASAEAAARLGVEVEPTRERIVHEELSGRAELVKAVLRQHDGGGSVGRAFVRRVARLFAGTRSQLCTSRRAGDAAGPTRAVPPPPRGVRARPARGRIRPSRRRSPTVGPRRNARPAAGITNSDHRVVDALRGRLLIQRADQHRVVPVHRELVLGGKAGPIVGDGVMKAAGGELPVRMLVAELEGTRDGAAETEVRRGGAGQQPVAARCPVGRRRTTPTRPRAAASRRRSRWRARPTARAPRGNPSRAWRGSGATRPLPCRHRHWCRDGALPPGRRRGSTCATTPSGRWVALQPFVGACSPRRRRPAHGERHGGLDVIPRIRVPTGEPRDHAVSATGRPGSTRSSRRAERRRATGEKG